MKHFYTASGLLSLVISVLCIIRAKCADNLDTQFVALIYGLVFGGIGVFIIVDIWSRSTP